MKWAKWRHLAGSLIGLGLLAVAGWVLRDQWQARDKIIHQLTRFLHHRMELAAAVGLTVVAYLVLTGYDLLAMRWIGHRLSVGKVAFTSFLAYVFSNNIGMSVVGASAVRLRLYPGWGLSVTEVVKIVAFVAFTFWLGLLNIAGLNFIVRPAPLPENWHLPGISTTLPVGIILLLVIVGYVVLCHYLRTPLRLGKRELFFPNSKIAVAQVAVGSLDWALAAGIYFVLLNALAHRTAPLSAVMVAYFLSVILGQASHSPGGLVVFEASLVKLLEPHGINAPEILAAAVAYRAIYLILPLLVGAVSLGGFELFHRRRT